MGSRLFTCHNLDHYYFLNIKIKSCSASIQLAVIADYYIALCMYIYHSIVGICVVQSFSITFLDILCLKKERFYLLHSNLLSIVASLAPAAPNSISIQTITNKAACLAFLGFLLSNCFLIQLTSFFMAYMQLVELEDEEED